MITFLIISGALALLAALLVVRPLIGGRAEAMGQDAMDAQVFRDQLAELDRDLARGTIRPEEAEGARIEISRRLLTATARARGAGALSPAPAGVSRWAALVAVVCVPVFAAGVYVDVGAPGAPDRPFASRGDEIAAARASQRAPEERRRPTQAEAEAAMAAQSAEDPAAEPDSDYAALVERLEGILEKRPDDLEGHRLLANGLMRLARWDEAWRVQARMIELAGEDVAAEHHAVQAEAMVMAAGGYVSPEAEQAIARALRMDPRSPQGRYYAGLSLRQGGRPEAAVRIWEGLRTDAPPDAPYLPYLDALLTETRAALDGSAPATTAPGPSAEDIEAAGEMSAEDRAAMIEGMVARLEDRLTTQGGEVEEWVRLMNAQVQLGRPEEAARVLSLAIAAQGDKTAVSFLREQALLMGLEIQ